MKQINTRKTRKIGKRSDNYVKGYESICKVKFKQITNMNSVSIKELKRSKIINLNTNTLMKGEEE